MRLATPSSLAVAGGFLESPWAQGPGTDFSKIDITADKIAPNLYMLSGSAGLDPGHQDAAGGRIGVLAGPDGIFMVDSQYGPLTDKVLAAIRQISPAPIRFMPITHVHIDHTGGNANFAKMGVTIFAREELREELLHPPTLTNGNPAPARDPASLPVVTYGLGGPVKIPYQRRNRRLDSGSRGPYRWRYDDPVRECERDHDRRFLSTTGIP